MVDFKLVFCAVQVSEESVDGKLMCIYLTLYIRRDVDKVHDMMDDVAEQQELAKEITEAISNPLAFQTDYDEVRNHHFNVSFIPVF
jgi:hypothetical protein